MKAPVELLAVAQTGLALRADPGDVFGVALVVGLGVVLLLVVSAMARPARGAERDVESSTMEPLSPEDALKLVAREAGSRLLLCPPGRNWGTATGAHPVAQWHWAQQWLRLRDSYNAKDYRLRVLTMDARAAGVFLAMPSRSDESRIILLQGFNKKEDALAPGEVTRAIARRDYYLATVQQTEGIGQIHDLTKRSARAKKR